MTLGTEMTSKREYSLLFFPNEIKNMHAHFKSINNEEKKIIFNSAWFISFQTFYIYKWVF